MIKFKFIILISLLFSCASLSNFDLFKSKPRIEVLAQERISLLIENSNLFVSGRLVVGNESITTNFLIDTGSDTSIISNKVLGQFNNPRKGALTFVSAALGRTGQGTRCLFDKIELGSAVIHKPELVAVDFDQMGWTNESQNGHGTIEGVIGMDFLSLYPFFLSYEKKELRFVKNSPISEGVRYPLFQPQTFTIEPDLAPKEILVAKGMKPPATASPRKLSLGLEIKIAGESRVVAMDTGAFASFYPNMRISIDDEVRNHPFDWIITRIPMQSIFYGIQRNAIVAGKTFPGVYTIVSPSDVFTVGNQVLSAFNWFIDYQGGFVIAKEVSQEAYEHYLDTKGHGIFPFSDGLFGFSTQNRDGKEIISQMDRWGDGSFLVPELKEGDEILSINSIPMNEFQKSKLIDLEEITVEIKRGEDFPTQKVTAKRHRLNLN